MWRVVLILSLIFNSCSGRSSKIAIMDYQPMAVAQWVERYGDKDVVRVDGYDGLFLKIISRSDSKIKPKVGDWVRINYTRYLFGSASSGRIMVSRYESVAKQMGWWSATTKYESEFVRYPDGLLIAESEALSQMSMGDSVRIYTASQYAYGERGLTINPIYGFGSGTIPADVPLIIDMALVGIVENPETAEAEVVRRYALDSLGIIESATAGIYFLVEGVGKDFVTSNSVVEIDYCTKFLDGFLLDTNIDSIARRYYREVDNSGRSLRVAVNSSTLLSVLHYVLPRMRVGQSAKIVFTSTWGYGKNGYQGLPTVQPYTPLFMEVRVLSLSD